MDDIETEGHLDLMMPESNCRWLRSLGGRAAILACIAAGMLLLLVLGIFVLVGWDSARYRNQLSRLDEIKIGDTSDKVQRVLGTPINQYAAGTKLIINYEHDTWVYRRLWKWDVFPEYPFVSFWEFRFIPLENDIAIEFGKKGTVLRVHRPPE